MNVTAFIDTHGHPHAAPYFQTFQQEPLVGSEMAQVVSIVPVTPWNLATLLTAITRAANGTNLMIVSHGASGGLSIPLSSHLGGLGMDSIAALGRYERGEIRDADVPVIFGGMRPSEVAALVQLTRAVRTRQFGTVVLRACRVGSNAQLLDALRGFFGARTICGPDLWDFFGTVNPGTPTTAAAAWTQWLRQHPGAVTFGQGGSRFALAIENDRRISAIADSWPAVAAWIRANLPPGRYPGQGRFPLHCMLNSQAIFPMQAAYRQHLHRSP